MPPSVSPLVRSLPALTPHGTRRERGAPWHTLRSRACSGAIRLKLITSQNLLRAAVFLNMMRCSRPIGGASFAERTGGAEQGSVLAESAEIRACLEDGAARRAAGSRDHRVQRPPERPSCFRGHWFCTAAGV